MRIECSCTGLYRPGTKSRKYCPSFNENEKCSRIAKLSCIVTRLGAIVSRWTGSTLSVDEFHSGHRAFGTLQQTLVARRHDPFHLQHFESRGFLDCIGHWVKKNSQEKYSAFLQVLLDASSICLATCLENLDAKAQWCQEFRWTSKQSSSRPTKVRKYTSHPLPTVRSRSFGRLSEG